MARIRDASIKAPSGWWICDPDTGTLLESNSYANLVGKVRLHRNTNKLDVSNVEQIINDIICKRENDLGNAFICGDGVLTEQSYSKYAPSPKLTDMISSFSKEMVKWAAKGFHTTDENTFQSRLKTCRSCEFWDEKAMGGTGRCRKCGCSGIKLHVITAKCPLNKW